MANQVFVTAISVFLVLFAIPSFADKTQPRHEYDRASKNRTGLKESDVCLSCRFFRDKPVEEIMKEWRATRLEWSYISAPEPIKAVQSAGVTFVGTLNTIAFDGPDQDAEMFDGSRAVAPWMTQFNSGKGVGWACVNKSITLSRRQAQLKNYLDLNVNTIQHDDWLFNAHSYRWGACFCKYCMEGFAQYLEENATPDDLKAAGVTDWRGFDYREYLKAKYGWTTNQQLLAGRGQNPLDRHFRMFQILSSRRYFDALLVTDKPVNLTLNGGTAVRNLINNFLLDRADYLMGETQFAGPERRHELVYGLKLADALCLPQVISPFADGDPSVPEVRRAIALTYAMGHRLLVPWDVYMPNDKPRWFGKVEEYGDLYTFVRENAPLLDGYRAWADVVVTAPLSTQMVAEEESSRNLVRFIMRAGYPCRLATYGVVGDIVHVPIEPKDFQDAKAIVVVPCSKLTSEDSQALGKCLEGMRTVDAGGFDHRAICREIGKICPAAYSTDSPDLLILPRWKPADPKAPHVIHLINTADDGGKASIWLASRICGIPKPHEVLLIQPGQKPLTLNPKYDSDGLQIDGLQVGLWGMLVIR